MSDRRWPWLLFAAAIIVRIVAGLTRTEDQLLHDGYEFYLTISRNFLDGAGLCYSVEGGCTARMPLYPLWLSAFVASGSIYPGLIVAQAIVGGTLTLAVSAIATRLFDTRVALLAAAAAAFNPYTVIHDTALQDTVFVNVFIAFALWFLLRGQAGGSNLDWITAGVALSAAVLTHARIALFVPLAIAWTIAANGSHARARLRAAVGVTLPVVILVGGWMVRNWTIAGVPALTTEIGEGLWYANNRSTFAHFPERSIDLAGGELMQLPNESRALLDNGTEAERNALLRRLAIDYMTADPLRTMANGVRKVWVSLSAQLSPARGPLVQTGYRIVFLPIHLVALITLLRVGSDWRRHGPAMLLLGAFAVTTALFWAHTSHKSYLDAVLCIYAAAGACAVWLRRRRGGVAH